MSRAKLWAMIAVAVLTATLSGTTTASAVETNVDPAALPRGAEARVPHLEGKEVVDGAVRIPIKSPGTPHLIAKTPQGYIVAVDAYLERSGTVMSVSEREQRVLARGGLAGGTQVNAEGTMVAFTDVRTADKRVTILDLKTGKAIAERSFPDRSTVLGVAGRSAFLAGPAGTFRWYYQSDRVVKLSRARAYQVDLANRLFASSKRIDGECSRIWRLGTPGQTVWSSCRERVYAFNPDGTRILTSPSLGEHTGPGTVWLRSTGGGKLATFSAGNGSIGTVSFESRGTVLMDIEVPGAQALVRGWAGGANRATAITRR